MVEQVTRVPNAAPFVDGVVFSRGQVVPAVNLRSRFGFERAPYDLRTRLIVVQAGGRSVGLIVDEGREFLRLPASAIQPPQESLAGLSSRYVKGIASVKDRLILVLKLDQLAELRRAADRGLNLETEHGFEQSPRHATDRTARPQTPC